jgi:hypothetical protein
MCRCEDIYESVSVQLEIHCCLPRRGIDCVMGTSVAPTGTCMGLWCSGVGVGVDLR